MSIMCDLFTGVSSHDANNIANNNIRIHKDSDIHTWIKFRHFHSHLSSDLGQSMV